MGNLRNVDILDRILCCCDDIAEVRQRCGDSFEALKADRVCTYAAAMCLYMIGQLANRLTGDFKAIYNNVSWPDISVWSNLAAYSRDNLDHGTLWKAMTEDIPRLRLYCEQIISRHSILNHIILPVREPDI